VFVSYFTYVVVSIVLFYIKEVVFLCAKRRTLS
jgi:hypothetical protein